MRIFLDANILFSAAKSDGAIRRLLSLLVKKRHECVVDTYVIEEAYRNLAVKAPECVQELQEMLSEFLVVGFQLPESGFAKGVALPDKDRPVLFAAVRSDCSMLVTGDQAHFGQLYGKTILGVRIHSPRSLAEALRLI